MKQQTAVEWLENQIMTSKYFYSLMKELNSRGTIVQPNVFEQAKSMEKDQRGYSEEDVIKIVEKSRETGLTAEYLLLTFKQQEQINKE
jgi:hydroxymethylpyrimidine/phosphomethylpyrimidine kinase